MPDDTCESAGIFDSPRIDPPVEAQVRDDHAARPIIAACYLALDVLDARARRK